MTSNYLFLKDLADGSTYHLGTAVYYPNGPGWRFLSNVTSHKSSRKFHATMEACVPHWARHARCEAFANRDTSVSSKQCGEK